jgi:hypothetical protein
MDSFNPNLNRSGFFKSNKVTLMKGAATAFEVDVDYAPYSSASAGAATALPAAPVCYLRVRTLNLQGQAFDGKIPVYA